MSIDELIFPDYLNSSFPFKSDYIVIAFSSLLLFVLTVFFMKWKDLLASNRYFDIFGGNALYPLFLE